MKQLLYACGVLVSAAAIVGATRYRQDIAALVQSEPVSVVGVLTSGGRPLGGITIQLALDDGANPRSAVTSSRGAFALSFTRAGDYTALIGPSTTIVSATRDLTLTWGTNDVSIDIPPTQVDVTLSLAGPVSKRTAIQVALWGPGDKGAENLGALWTDTTTATVRYFGLAHGDYSLTAYSGDGHLVSSAPARFELAPFTEHVAAELNLVAGRSLSLAVTDTTSRPIAAADVFSFGRSALVTRPGEFNMSRIPFGQHAMVTAPGMLPACITAAESGLQTIVLHKKTHNTADLRLLGGPRRPVGFLLGLPGSDCGVPLSSLDVRWSPPVDEPYVHLTIEGLPKGMYEYRAQQWVPGVPVSVPGPVVQYTIPSFCRFCGG